MGRALGLKLSVAKAEEEAADSEVKVLGRAVWRREHMRRHPEADQTANPLRRQPTCKHTQPNIHHWWHPSAASDTARGCRGCTGCSTLVGGCAALYCRGHS